MTDDKGNREGGVNFGGGAVTIHGDVVGHDKNVTTGSGLSADDVVKLFDSIYKKIDQLPTSVDKDDVREAVDTIKDEAAKDAAGKPTDEKLVKLSAQSIAGMAPDILEVIAATLVNPAAGVAAIIRKVIDKAKAAGNAG